MGDLFTVDQLAQILDLHPRTIRRYIREDKLKAVKVGGEWRIRKEDAEAFIGSKVNEYKAEAISDVRAFVDGKDSELHGNYQVCTILDCYVDNEEASKISEIIMRHIHTNDPPPGMTKYQFWFDDAERKGRYILWGNPAFIGRVLTAISEVVR